MRRILTRTSHVRVNREASHLAQRIAFKTFKSFKLFKPPPFDKSQGRLSVLPRRDAGEHEGGDSVRKFCRIRIK